MDSKTKQILENDPIANVEKITNKNWQEFNPDEENLALFLAMMNNQQKNNYLKDIRDTYFSMTWQEFKNLLTQKGFVVAYSYTFSKYENQVDEAILAYNKDKGWVVFAESYREDVNSGTCYLEIKANSLEDAHNIWGSGGSGGFITHTDTENILDKSYDVREGLFSKLEDLMNYGTFLSVWTEKDKFLWFVDYSESGTGDYKEITQSKIEKCPAEFRQIIGR